MSDLIERWIEEGNGVVTRPLLDKIEAREAEIARLRRGLENACICLGRIRSDKDASYAAEGHDKARAALEFER